MLDMSEFNIDLTDLGAFVYREQDEVSVVKWQGHSCLCLNGLVFIPNMLISEGGVDVYIGSDDVSYSGIAFRLMDPLNYELAYAQPHTSGRWDALQYDPVFHGINSWQIYHGEGAQQATEVPTGKWFRLSVDFKDHRAVIRVNDQDPLVIPQLVHDQKEGLIGLWSYKPAYFRDLRIRKKSSIANVSMKALDYLHEGAIKDWFLEGYGRIASEYNGNVNLHRFLPSKVTEVKLTRRFELMNDSEIILKFGFSDEIAIWIDEETVFTGENKFTASPEWKDQGYVYLDKQMTIPLNSGIHTIEVNLKRTEPFGFGFCMSLFGESCRLLSCEF